MSEENEKKDVLDEIKEEMAKMREEMSELRKNTPKSPKSPKPPREPDNKFFSVIIDDDDFEFEGFNEGDIEDTLNSYFSSVMSGVSDNLKRSMDDMARSFRNLEVHTANKMRHKAERELRKQERKLNHAARKVEHATHKRTGRRVHLYPLSPEELEEFLDDAPNILSALTDKRRLQILKILEKGATYPSEISDKTDIKGGTFKHHMDILLNAKFVHQEATRGRYLITQLGIEGLKLAELLFRRHRFEIKKSESREDGDVHDVTVDFEDEIEDLEDTVDEIEDTVDDLEDIVDEMEEDNDQ